MSLFRCPLCASPLTREERSYTCPRRHSFDIAREGYVHLLPADKLHSRHPGDDKEMVAARTRFLDGGFYAPLREALCRLTAEHLPEGGVLLDVGCGEGYYTAGVAAALTAAGRSARIAGVDLSKPSLKKAAKRLRSAEFAVASVYHLPLAGESVDLILNCFAPLALEEYLRVLKPGGIYLYVTPAAEHLWELKQVLYEKPYLNVEEHIPYEGLEHLEVIPVETVLRAEGAALMDLFRMTPYYWKTPRAGKERLGATQQLDVTAAFRIRVFRKI